MPEKLISSLPRWILACAVLLGSAALGPDASSQVNPPGPPPAQGAPVNPMCPRLEAQLSTIDHGGSGDPARDEQVRRYQDAAGRQQGDGNQSDPLGRPLHGKDFGDDLTVKIPGEIDVQRVRRILEELRRRLADPQRPQIELDYLERLLKDY